MPNTRNLNGTVVTAGRYRGDDEVATRVIVERHVVGGNNPGVHMDPSNLEGPIVVKYNLNTGQKGFTVEEKSTGEDVFSIAQDGATVVSKQLRVLDDTNGTMILRVLPEAPNGAAAQVLIDAAVALRQG